MTNWEKEYNEKIGKDLDSVVDKSKAMWSPNFAIKKFISEQLDKRTEEVITAIQPYFNEWSIEELKEKFGVKELEND